MSVHKGTSWLKRAIRGINRTTASQFGRMTARMKGLSWGAGARAWVIRHKKITIAGCGIAGAALLTAGGYIYTDQHTSTVYHVFVGKQEIGVVSNPRVINEYISLKSHKLESEHPEMNVELTTDEIVYRDERAYKAKFDNKAALNQLSGFLVPEATGVEVVVNGKVIGTVKDRQTAEQLLSDVKDKYVPAKKSGQVQALAAHVSVGSQPSGTVKSVKFKEKVDLLTVTAKPEQINEPQEVLNKLEQDAGKVETYTVVKGDTISAIAKKVHMTQKQIRSNNTWIQEDRIDIGDELKLTVAKPLLTVVAVNTKIENKTVPYGTIIMKDSTMKKGKLKQVQAGKDGLKKVTSEVTTENGVVMDVKTVDKLLLTKPVSRIVKQGTKVISEGSGRFAWPVIGATLSSKFGVRWGKLHKGIDLASGNHSILAADSGKVVFAGKKNGYGNAIIIDHSNGYRTLYGHLSKISVRKGQTVEKGEKIGVMGNTGHSFGTHLHFEVIKNGDVTNPLKYLKR